MGLLHKRQIVDELPGPYGAQIAYRVGQILNEHGGIACAEVVCHRASAVPALEEDFALLRLRTDEVEREVAVSKDKFVDDFRADDVAPAGRDVLGPALGVDIATRAREKRSA